MIIDPDLSHMIGLVSTGSLMGIIHVLAGVDHLSALATLSVGSSWRAIRLGIRWGLGHSTGLILVTIIFLLLKGEVNMSSFKKYCDGLVGLFMIILGLQSIYSAVKTYRNPQHQHLLPLQQQINDLESVLSQDENKKHDSSTTTVPSSLLHFNLKDNTTQRIVAFVIGVVHGIAGPGGMLGVVPAVEMKSLYSSILYLTSFTVSSTLCMGIFAAVFGEMTRRAGSTSGLMELLINLFSSLLSIAVGATWMVLSSTGRLEELFEE
jgi:hypothetical protein